jgi:hypothetical protein
VSRGFENAPERLAPTRAPASSTRIPRPKDPTASRHLTLTAV